MARYQKYDINTKVALIEEYLERNRNDNSYSMAQFSLEKGIADSTFNNWVLKYKHDKNTFILLSYISHVYIIKDPLRIFHIFLNVNTLLSISNFV